MLSATIDAGHDVAPELWRRYLAIVLQGLRAEPAPPEPLPAPPVSPKQMDKVLMGAWRQRQGWGGSYRLRRFRLALMRLGV
jgi:hypothetical protein